MSKKQFNDYNNFEHNVEEYFFKFEVYVRLLNIKTTVNLLYITCKI